MRDEMPCFSIALNNHGSGDNKETPPQLVACVLTFSPMRESATPSLTAATSAFNEEEGQKESNQKRPAESRPEANESPSPVQQRKNPLPNFDLCPLDDDSVLSGDESDRWEAKEDKMVSFFSEQTRKEDELDNATLLECPPC